MNPQLEKTILEALDSEDPNVLRAACLMAGLLKLEQAERGLIKALAHKAWQVQAEAARALGRLRLKGALPFLRRILKASETDLRQKMLAAAAGTLAGGPGGAAAEGETNPELLKQAAIALNRIAPETTEQALLAALSSPQPNLVSAALAGLANLESEAGAPRILELLESKEAPLRRLAAACVGKLRLRPAVPRLMALVSDDDGGVRREAVIALNHIKENQAIPALAACLEDKDPEVRRVAVIALGNTRSRQEEVVDALLGRLGDHDPQVRQASLSALANLRAARALEACAGLLSDPHEKVSRQAAVTVGALGLARERPEYGE